MNLTLGLFVELAQRLSWKSGLALVSFAVAGTFLSAGCSADNRTVKLSDLQCYPPEIKLNSAKARQEIVVQAVYADGVTRDVTTQAKFSLAKPQLAGIANAVISPVTNGETELRVTFGGRSQIIPVSVSGATVAPPISFKLDVMPVFTKAGCNTGACHGTSRGKDGFHLSLFGFDPDGDYFRLTREQIGRRINLAIPTESLIVQKGLGAVQHTVACASPRTANFAKRSSRGWTPGRSLIRPMSSNLPALKFFRNPP